MPSLRLPYLTRSDRFETQFQDHKSKQNEKTNLVKRERRKTGSGENESLNGIESKIIHFIGSDSSEGTNNVCSHDNVLITNHFGINPTNGFIKDRRTSEIIIIRNRTISLKEKSGGIDTFSFQKPRTCVC